MIIIIVIIIIIFLFFLNKKSYLDKHLLCSSRLFYSQTLYDEFIHLLWEIAIYSYYYHCRA